MKGIMNSNFFENVEIRNFKSIEKVDFKCKRINVFIGKPNVGKSCIIEALSLLADPELLSNQFVKNLVNFENYYNLFHNNNFHKNITIDSDKSKAFINYNNQFNYLLSNNVNLIHPNNKYLFSDYQKIEEIYQSFKAGQGFTDISFLSPINEGNFIHYIVYNNSQDTKIGFTKPYKFMAKSDYSIMEKINLRIPNGDNLFWIISQSEQLQEEIANYLNEYNLELVYDSAKNTFLSQKKMKTNVVVQIPYSLIADTLQRIIFYTAAIYSNENSILLFEEPEVNSFPPYIRELANKILLSKSNQFFITTHSPYLLTTLLEDSGNEVMLNVVGYKDGKTVIHQISKDEVKELLSYDSDIFLNIDRYI